MNELTSLPENYRAGYVAIVGEPNVGKSTLLNAVLGQKISIVTPKAQTTRHRLLGIHSTERFQIVFLDTPGIIRPRYALQESMMRSAASALDDADLVLCLVDGARKPGESAEMVVNALRQRSQSFRPVYLVLNKCDLASRDSLDAVQAYYAEQYPFTRTFQIAALKRQGTEELIQAVAGALPPHPPFYPVDIVSEQHQRFFVSEMIREQIFLNTHEEVPYATTVDIVDFSEREAGKWFISADVYVERDSQKGILIGKNGGKLKEIGKRARQEIERFLEHPVYLDLHVKVREKWREKPEWLKRLGYQ